jgi:cysteine dioxygenase
MDWADDHYTRHLIHRDAHFDIMALCWQPGQGTPVHTHNGQLGWAFATSGAIECTEYEWLGCDRPQNQDVSGLDCVAGGRQVRHRPLETARCDPGGAVSRVTKAVTTHSLRVPDDCTERSVSLHVYSLPFDSCVVFDLAEGTCGRRQLAFDSVPPGVEAPLR